MKLIILAAFASATLSLAACGGDGDDALSDRAEEQAESKADALDAAASNASGPQEDALADQAEAVREAGDAKEEAIDNTDVDTDDLTPAQQNALVNAQ
jgi:ABC-type glycerol-3-phosphate transport system substrate-binding protein